MWPALRWTNTFLLHVGHQTLGTFACPTIQPSGKSNRYNAVAPTLAASKATYRAWIHFSTRLSSWPMPTAVLMWREAMGLQSEVR